MHAAAAPRRRAAASSDRPDVADDDVGERLDAGALVAVRVRDTGVSSCLAIDRHLGTRASRSSTPSFRRPTPSRLWQLRRGQAAAGWPASVRPELARPAGRELEGRGQHADDGVRVAARA